VASGTVESLTDTDLSRMLHIRHFEQALLELSHRGQLAGTVHTCIGQEYIPVALAPLLLPGDFVFSNHRGHGHYLALVDDASGLLAEILGRDGGVCRGVGGSQHVYRPGRFLSTGVQGEGIAAAVGVGLHLSRAGGQQVAVAFIGDGTFGEGAVYEALNMAQLWHVPLVVVVEHNGIAQSTPTTVQMAGSVAGRAAAFEIPHQRLTSTDPATIRGQARPLIERARRSSTPVMLEFETVRVGPHSKGDDSRPAEELARVRAMDWAHLYRQAYPDQFERIDRTEADRIRQLVEQVLARPLSSWEPAHVA
jgi:pyruvate dehydrogenase E1 component alpha subunit